MHAYKTAYTDDWLHFEPISRILDIRHKIVLNIFLFLFNKKIIHSKSLVATIYWKAIGREGEYLKLMLLMSAHLSKRMPKKMSFFEIDSKLRLSVHFPISDIDMAFRMTCKIILLLIIREWKNQICWSKCEKLAIRPRSMRFKIRMGK